MRTLLLILLVLAVPCGATSHCPPLSDVNVYLMYTGSESGCSAVGGTACYFGEMVSFEAKAFAYTFCSDQKFEWRFSDGLTASGTKVSRVFPLPGVYEAVLTVRGANSLATANTLIHLYYCDPRPRGPYIDDPPERGNPDGERMQ